MINRTAGPEPHVSAPSDARRLSVAIGLLVSLIVGAAFFAAYLGGIGIAMVGVILAISIVGAAVIRSVPERHRRR